MMTDEKKIIAREFRKNPTISEHILWEALRKRNLENFKFRRQYVIEGYVIDFYCPELHLGIEVDGSIHSGCLKQDKYRQEILEKRGITFFRVSAEEVENNIDRVLSSLKKYLVALTPAPLP